MVHCHSEYEICLALQPQVSSCNTRAHTSLSALLTYHPKNSMSSRGFFPPGPGCEAEHLPQSSTKVDLYIHSFMSCTRKNIPLPFNFIHFPPLVVRLHMSAVHCYPTSNMCPAEPYGPCNFTALCEPLLP